ncbi:MAG TPA: hypothetical protein VFP58_05865, partial [Candidatus Eisenbacteria bacterium]|nr:hypothetical protein [Candidatus Eisenbacteria bacterium]
VHVLMLTKEPTMMRSILRSTAVAGAAAFLVAATAPSVTAGQPPKTPSAPSAQAAPANDAFARVYLALRGCTSCSHCRTNIRQMVKSKSDGGEARVATDQVEIRYPKPRPVPLRDVVRSLAENRLHDLSLVDVLFEAKGSIAATRSGTTFRMAETGQSFPISIGALKRPADGAQVRVTALVDGWRTKGAKGANGANGDLSLVARSIEAVN